MGSDTYSTKADKLPTPSTHFQGEAEADGAAASAQPATVQPETSTDAAPDIARPTETLPPAGPCSDNCTCQS